MGHRYCANHSRDYGAAFWGSVRTQSFRIAYCCSRGSSHEEPSNQHAMPCENKYPELDRIQQLLSEMASKMLTHMLKEEPQPGSLLTVSKAATQEEKNNSNA